MHHIKLYPRPLQKLIDLFIKFPGIGPKQATRFAFYLLKEDSKTVFDLADAIKELKGKVGFCAQCYKSLESSGNTLCEFCSNKSRDKRIILIVEKEADLVNVERTKKYNGLYHVLGGSISPLDPSAPTKLHIKDLFIRIKNLLDEKVAVDPVRSPPMQGVQKGKQGEADLRLDSSMTPVPPSTSNGVEVILATNPTTEGDTTALYIERVLKPLGVKISRLGRGLSLGSELEYADDMTIKEALTNRK